MSSFFFLRSRKKRICGVKLKFFDFVLFYSPFASKQTRTLLLSLPFWAVYCAHVGGSEEGEVVDASLVRSDGCRCGK